MISHCLFLIIIFSVVLLLIFNDSFLFNGLPVQSSLPVVPVLQDLKYAAPIRLPDHHPSTSE